LVPSTADGRVLFAVPWLGKVILGTTDTPRQDLPREPEPFEAEVDFILREAGRYLEKAPTRADVRSVWVGLRPLVKPQRERGENTKGLSREHTVLSSASGMVTVTGGKWTTYRAMAEDVLAQCVRTGALQARSVSSGTADCRLVGAQAGPSAVAPVAMTQPPGAHLYGSEQAALHALPGAEVWLCEGLSEAMVRFAARYEFARTVEDVLARRSRLLFLDARQAVSVAPAVAQILVQETGFDPQLDGFKALAQHYSLP